MSALPPSSSVPDGSTAFRRYGDLHRAHPNREFCFVHTSNAVLEITERPWFGIRSNAALY